MGKSKYIYIHKFNGLEVEKSYFYLRLSAHFYDIIGEINNPYNHVKVINDKEANKEYKRLMRTGKMKLIIDHNGKGQAFQIIKRKVGK